MRRFSPVPLLKAVAFAVVLVLAVDYASFAATGQSALLGRLNKANKVTAIERTTTGPALSLVTKPGSAPLKVNRPVKVANLNADRLDGLDSTRLARRPIVTGLDTASGCAKGLTSVTPTFQKILDFATFTKTADDTLIRLDLANRLYIDAMTGGGAIFEMRVDDQPTTLGTATTLIRADDVKKYLPNPMFGVFEGLPAGEHTVSMWVRVNYGTGTTALFDPGCWNTAGVNSLLVTEF